MKSYKVIVFILFISLFTFQLVSNVYAQQAPTYSFIKFDASYESLKNQAKKDGYIIEEKNIDSVYGQSLLLMTKSLNFYIEKVYLFFNENKELIYFNVDLSLKQNQPRRILEELYISIRDKLIEKYGENGNQNFPFYKIVGNQYEIFLHPFQAYSNELEVSFKYIERYNQYQDYYNQHIKELETKEINQTVNNF